MKSFSSNKMRNILALRANYSLSAIGKEWCRRYWRLLYNITQWNILQNIASYPWSFSIRKMHWRDICPWYQIAARNLAETMNIDIFHYKYINIMKMEIFYGMIVAKVAVTCRRFHDELKRQYSAKIRYQRRFSAIWYLEANVWWVFRRNDICILAIMQAFALSYRAMSNDE